MTDQNALFIVNALSERVARKTSALQAYAKGRNIPVHVVGADSSAKDPVATALKDGKSHIFIEGGDGTVHNVLTSFLRQRADFEIFPHFTIVPGGMTNQVAKNIGLKSPTAKYIEAALSQKASKSIPLIQIESPDHPALYGFLFSTGAVPMITDYTKSKLHGRGIGGSVAVAGGIMKGISGNSDDVMHNTKIEIDMPETNLNEEHLGTLVTTLPGLILGLDPFWGESPAPLRMTYVSGQSKALLRNVAGLWLGHKSKDRQKDGFKSWNTDTAAFQYDGPVVLDGEPLDFPSGAFVLRATDPIEFVY